jgi:hypothetical protein
MSSPLKEWMLEWAISEEDWSWVKHGVSDKMSIESYGSRIVLWFQRILSSIARSWMNHIALNIPYIRERTRCIKTWIRNSQVCGRMWQMLESQGLPSEIHWKSTTFEYPRVEVGRHMYVLHCGSTSHLAWAWLYMGHCGSFDEVISLHTFWH